jgi:hypothetical protein
MRWTVLVALAMALPVMAGCSQPADPAEAVPEESVLVQRTLDAEAVVRWPSDCLVPATLCTRPDFSDMPRLELERNESAAAARITIDSEDVLEDGAAIDVTLRCDAGVGPECAPLAHVESASLPIVLEVPAMATPEGATLRIDLFLRNGTVHNLPVGPHAELARQFAQGPFVANVHADVTVVRSPVQPPALVQVEIVKETDGNLLCSTTFLTDPPTSTTWSCSFIDGYQIGFGGFGGRVVAYEMTLTWVAAQPGLERLHMQVSCWTGAIYGRDCADSEYPEVEVTGPSPLVASASGLWWPDDAIVFTRPEPDPASPLAKAPAPAQSYHLAIKATVMQEPASEDDR